MRYSFRFNEGLGFMGDEFDLKLIFLDGFGVLNYFSSVKY